MKALQIDGANNKSRDLILGLVFDAIGMMSFTIPFLGEFSDIVWAPAAAYLMSKMYKGTAGKVGSTFAFLEELLPFVDFVPSFTLMWIYTYVIKNKNAQ